MTSTTRSKPARRFVRAITAAIIALLVLSTFALAPAAEAQSFDFSSQWEVVTQPCADGFVPGVDNGKSSCWQYNPGYDAYHGGEWWELEGWTCAPYIDGRPVTHVWLDEPSYTADYCFYHPGFTFQRTYSAPVWTVPSYGAPSTWTLS